MPVMILASAFAAVVSFAISILLMPVTLRMAHRKKWYDAPNNRKIHTGLIPRLGGPAMFASFVVAAALASVLGPMFSGGDPGAWTGARILFLFAGIFVIHGAGLYDDFRNVKAVLKFLLQLLAAGIVAAGGYLIRTITLPYVGTFTLGPFAYPVTVLWIVGITNALNLIDGMDGLAGGIAAFASLSMGAIALLQGAGLTAVLCLALFGGIIGFLRFNFPPARMFMGDSGSYFLGFALAVLPLVGGISKSSAFGALLVPVTLLTIPIVDTAMAILRRLRHRRSIVAPDKEHMHHKLLAMGLNERQILAVVYGFCGYLSIVSISSVVLPQEVDVYLIMVVWVGSLLATWLLYFVGVKNRSATRRESDREEDSPSASSGLPRSG